MALTLGKGIQMKLDSFIEKVITEYQSRHGVTVLHFDLDSPGEVDARRCSHSSVRLLNLIVNSGGRISRTSVILKVPHLSSSYERYQMTRLYQKEAYMYTKVLPRLYRIWHGEIMAPYFYTASENGMLAMENLTERGFRVWLNDLKLNLNECEIVLERLAQFHGVSVKYFELYGIVNFDKFKTKSSDCGFTFEGIFSKIRKYVSPSLSAEQLEIWKHFERNHKTLLKDVYSSPNIGGFNVLIHGNLHRHNLLLKEGRCKFIDFQLCRRGSPVLDLINFFVDSVKWKVFSVHREHLLNHYQLVLNKVLERVGCTRRYSLDELYADFEKYKLFCISVVSLHIPISWAEIVDNTEAIDETGMSKIDCLVPSAAYIFLFKSWIEVVRRGLKIE